MTVESAPTPMVPAFTLRAMKRAIAGNLWIIAACMTIPLVLAIAFLVVKPPRYEAVIEILVDPRGLHVVQNDVTPRAESNESAVSLVESQLRIVRSEGVLRSVIDRLHLDEDPEFLGQSRWLSRALAAISFGPKESPDITALRSLQQAVDTQRASRSYVILVKARSEDPAKAARIADAVGAAYIEHEVKARAETARRVGSTLASRLKELAGSVVQSEEAVEKFKRQNNLIGSGTRLISDQQLEEMNARLVAARAQTAAQRARLDQIEAVLRSGADPGAMVEAVQSTTIANLRTQYAAIMRQHGTALALLGPRHPDAKAIEVQKNRQLAAITDELKRIAHAARNDYVRAKANEDALAAELDALKRKAATSNEAMVRLRELERAAESNGAIYKAFLVRAKELGEQGGVDTLNTRLIAAALAPNRPITPRRNVLLLALIVGVVLSAGAVWVIRSV